MKRFVFPLQQIRTWNATRLQLEESELETIVDRQRRTEAAFSDLRAQQNQFEQRTLHQSLIEATELVRIEQFRVFVATEGRRLLTAQAEFAKQIGERRRRIIEIKRKIELLDRLRERQQTAWTVEETKELQTAADEAFLQKWMSRRD